MKNESLRAVKPSGSGPLSVAVLVLDNCNTLSFAAAVDPMRAANRRAGRVLFDWQFRTVGGAPARLTSGITVNGAALAGLDSCDLLLVLASFDLDTHATRRLTGGLRRIAGTGAVIAGIDGGPWLMAAAGLLDGHLATTHWEDLDLFEARFPAVSARRQRFVESGRMWTASGAAPCLDMMLHMIAQRFGPALSARVASAFIHDPVPDDQAQSPFSTPRPLRRHPVLASAITAMEAALEDPVAIPDIASLACVSTRRLEQLFAQHLALSPKAYYLQLRLSEAYRMATDTSLSVQEIAIATGFGHQSSLARAFKSAFGQSIRSVRHRVDGRIGQ